MVQCSLGKLQTNLDSKKKKKKRSVVDSSANRSEKTAVALTGKSCCVIQQQKRTSPLRAQNHSFEAGLRLLLAELILLMLGRVLLWTGQTVQERDGQKLNNFSFGSSAVIEDGHDL